MQHRDDRRHSRSIFAVGVIGLTLALAITGPPQRAEAQAARSVAVTTSDVHWTWDPVTVVGSSTLVRKDSEITAAFPSSQLPAGQGMTLWFIVFNNPGACASTPCGIGDLLNPVVQGDVLWGGGRIVGGSAAGDFRGHLPVGDASASGFLEIGLPKRAVGLLDPHNAEVYLVIHSQGPAVRGSVRVEQPSSYRDGCVTFLGGPDAIADGPSDVPDQVGECSTIQASVHTAVLPDRSRDPGEGGRAHVEFDLEARTGAVLDRSASVAAERALALLEAREAEHADDLASSAARRVEQQLVSALALKTPGELRDRLAVPAGARTGELEPQVSKLVRAEKHPRLDTPCEEGIPPPLKLVAHELCG